MRKKTSGLNQLMSRNMQTISYAIAIAIALTFTSIANAAQRPKICTDIHKILIQRQKGHEPKDFYIEYREQNGGDSYQGLDIDNNGVYDSVVRNCGVSFDSVCRLAVELSTGKKFELILEGEKFFLARVKLSVYVIVGESSKKEEDKRGKRRIYQLTKNNIKLICSHL